MKNIVIINYGSQYTQLIKARLRQLNYDAEILQPNATYRELNSPAGIILSGGPHSVYEEGAPRISEDLANLIFEKETPTLAICYGLQAIAFYAAKGRYETVRKGEVGGEYGGTTLKTSHNLGVLKGLSNKETVWMSHEDEVFCLPPNFELLASTQNCRLAAVSHITKPIFGLQFHPEVSHTICGKRILKNFLNICAVEPNWDSSQELQRIKQAALAHIGNKNIFAFISTGNDSSVLAKFLQEIVPPDRLRFCYVRGLSDYDEDLEKIELIGGNFTVVDARQKFLRALRGVVDPEEKRKIIGGIFFEIWQEFITATIYDKVFGVNMSQIWRKYGVNYLLAQGTIYPDIIEQGGSCHADLIKTHHNRVREIQDLLKVGGVIEPFNNLFKEDVRRIGKLLSVPDRLIRQHPSPGPGYAVRFLCSDYYLAPKDELYFQAISCECEIQKTSEALGYTASVLPIKSKGVQGDQGTYAYTVGIIGEYNRETLLSIATEIPNKFKGKINRVVYLIAPKDAPSLQFARIKRDYFRAKTRDLVDMTNKIFIKNLRLANLYSQISQAFAVVCPLGFNSGYSVILRAVDTVDFMTASPHWLPELFLEQVADQIMAKIPEIELVFYDLTSKPPGTIEWE